MLTTVQAAERLGVAPTTLVEWAYLGEFPHIKLKRHYRFREEDVQAWIDSHYHPVKQQESNGDKPT